MSDPSPDTADVHAADTSTALTSTAQAEPATDAQATPRKRKKRAPTAGAADDCFTCRERNVKCDRRRPYCSQCLDIKIKCSGYKTQLTWGVGVASRGKLRGLSLPVAKSQFRSKTTEKSASKKPTAATTSPSFSKLPSAPTTRTPSLPTFKPVNDTQTPVVLPQQRNPRLQTESAQSFQKVQQPLPTLGITPPPLTYEFATPGADTAIQSAPANQTSFDLHARQSNNATPEIREHQFSDHVHNSGSERQRDQRSLKRQALHLDTSDITPYAFHQQPFPMAAQPTLGAVHGLGHFEESPVSPYSQPLGTAYSRRDSLPRAGAQPVQFFAQNNLNRLRNRPLRKKPQRYDAPISSPDQWSTGYPSPQATSDHGSFISTPESALPPVDLADTSIGLAADQLLAMQQSQNNMFTQPAFTSFIPPGALTEVDDDEIEEIGRGTFSDQFPSPGDLIRINQTFASQEKIGNTPELRYLINYYLEVLTPVIIAFDGPGNPWRDHVLSLARHNEGLQHAIAALSASNIRMRREHKDDQPRFLLEDSVHDVSVRKSSEAHQRLNDEVDPPALSRPGRPSQREVFHKNEAVLALNNQLADPIGRSDDSILAVLLVICLYHMCETGVAKFKTQFAGVKNILAMRDRIGISRKNVSWIVTFFEWFDAMAATVNDRESQFTVTQIPLLPSGSMGEDWGLENLCGCDSLLFASVNELGRLNVLSQGRRPELSPEGSGMIPPPFFTPIAGPHGSHLHPNLVFDESGWAQFNPEANAAATAAARANATLSTSPLESRSAQFWAEWSKVRDELINWRFDPAHLPAPMRIAAQKLRSDSVSSAASVSSGSGYGPFSTSLPPHQAFADTSIADISNISESFRHAALLYTERLAWPLLPPEHPQLQAIVATALRYIRLVKSDVCLLWPLFIVGAECVRDEDRAMVRTRCWDIQKDSGFFNNIKCLELLQVIWARADREAKLRDASGGWNMPSSGEVFKWREEMKNTDGEYIVI